MTEVRQQQVPSHPAKQPQVNRSYGRLIQTEPTAATPANCEPNAAGHIITHTDRDAGNRGDDTAGSGQQHHDLHKNLAHDSLLSLKSITTEEGSRETHEITPISLENNVNQLPQHLLEENQLQHLLEENQLPQHLIQENQLPRHLIEERQLPQHLIEENQLP
jgi:hypothetical protein